MLQIQEHMDRNTPPESLPRFAPYTDTEADTAWHRSIRARLFAITFGLTLALGIGWILLQPVVYRSSATVLMSAPSAIDAKVEKANVQSVAIQRRILLGAEVTQGLLSALVRRCGLALSA
jgi:polysaccharide biosynthesis transport protein